jgi:hypothetical protein
MLLRTLLLFSPLLTAAYKFLKARIAHGIIVLLSIICAHLGFNAFTHKQAEPQDVVKQSIGEMVGIQLVFQGGLYKVDNSPQEWHIDVT